MNESILKTALVAQKSCHFSVYFGELYRNKPFTFATSTDFLHDLIEFRPCSIPVSRVSQILRQAKPRLCVKRVTICSRDRVRLPKRVHRTIPIPLALVGGCNLQERANLIFTFGIEWHCNGLHPR